MVLDVCRRSNKDIFYIWGRERDVNVRKISLKWKSQDNNTVRSLTVRSFVWTGQ